MSVAISATVQDVWPPRVQVAVTGLTVGDTMTLWRVVDGDRTLLRGGQVDAAADPSLVRVDAEAPINTSLTYVAAVDGIDHALEWTLSFVTGRRHTVLPRQTRNEHHVPMLAGVARLCD